MLKRLFESVVGRPADTKSSKAAALVAMQGAGRAVWTPRDYSALAREGYGRNPIVNRCVRLISEAAASVPLTLFAGGKELSSHPLLGLLAMPNPAMSGAMLLEEIYGHLLVAGNAYLERVTLDGRPRELHALRPDRVTVVPGTDGWPEAYDYTVGGRKVRFSREAGGAMPVLHLKIFHPLNDHYGFAPIEAAQMSLDIHNAASAWNKALLDNAARPSGALIYGAAERANMSDEQFDRLKSELEAGYQGARNAGRPLLLEGGLDWKPMGFTPRDMDFIEAKNQAAREIALAFGVPPMVLGIPGDNTYGNFQEANRAFWRQSVLPLAARAAEAIAAWMAPVYGENLRLAPDPDGVEALSSEREALWRRVEQASFLSRDERRVAVGYGIEGGEGGEGTN